MSTSTDSQTTASLSKILEIPQEMITQALLDSRSERGYTRYEIPKGNGKMRVIHAPSDELKSTQRAILERLLSRIPLSPFAHGFAPGKSIVTNAKVHASTARAVLSVDLLNAFPSVSEKRIAHLLEWRVGPILKLDLPALRDRSDLYRALTQLCTRDEVLPQGAPTSGYLLNLACISLDRKVFGLALKTGLPQVRYSRYADDLTITSSAPIPPEFTAAVQNAVKRSGFQVNPSKIETYTDTQRAIVICGVRLYQGQLALPKKTLHTYRALFDHALSRTAEEISSLERQKIMGTIAFLRYIYPACPTPLLKPLNRLLRAHGSWVKIPKDRDHKAPYRSFTYTDLNRDS